MSATTQYYAMTVTGTDANGKTVLGRVSVNKVDSLKDTLSSRAAGGSLFMSFTSTDLTGDTPGASILLPEDGSIIKAANRPMLNMGNDWGRNIPVEISVDDAEVLGYEQEDNIVYLIPNKPGTAVITITSTLNAEDTVSLAVTVDGVLLTDPESE